jgi:hypothetical protein
MTFDVSYSKGLFRIRVGDYRILYEVDYRNNLIGIVKLIRKKFYQKCYCFFDQIGCLEGDIEEK